MQKEILSVIIPTYNAAATLAEALMSVALQTEKQLHYEIIVCDDGSTDTTKLVVEAFQDSYPNLTVKYIFQENAGVSAARNAALSCATGAYIALLDADDVWLPRKIEQQMNVLRQRPEIELISGKRTHHTIRWPYSVVNGLARVTFDHLLIRTEIHPSTVLFRRNLLEKIGLFDPKQRYAEDVNFFLRAARKAPLYILDIPIIVAGGGKRTFGVSGLSANLEKMHLGFRKNLKEVYTKGEITFLKYLVLRLFYTLKYQLVRLRTIFNL